MSIYYFGGVFLVVPMMGNSVLRASGDTKTPAAIMTSAAIVNVILDPIFIFGYFGVPRMEISGAAVATVLKKWLLTRASPFRRETRGR